MWVGNNKNLLYVLSTLVFATFQSSYGSFHPPQLFQQQNDERKPRETTTMCSLYVHIRMK